MTIPNPSGPNPNWNSTGPRHFALDVVNNLEWIERDGLYRGGGSSHSRLFRHAPPGECDMTSFTTIALVTTRPCHQFPPKLDPANNFGTVLKRFKTRRDSTAGRLRAPIHRSARILVAW